MGVFRLGSIICDLLSMAKDKIVFARIEWARNTAYSLIYYPTLKFNCLDLSCKGIPVFYRVKISNPVYTFIEDRKSITLTSIKEDGMISHYLCNLILDSLE